MEFSNLTVAEGPLGNKELNFQPICGFAFRLGPLHSGLAGRIEDLITVLEKPKIFNLS